MIRLFIAALATIGFVNAWTQTPSYIIARIAEKDLEKSHPKSLPKALKMLDPLNNLTKAGNYPFEDAIAYPSLEFEKGFSLVDLWHYEYNTWFDGEEKKEIETHSDFTLLKIAEIAQYTIDSDKGRIDSTFGKSWNLRYYMSIVADLHQPMHNIIRFSSSHKNGDDFGKLYKIKGSYKNLYDLFDDAFGQYSSLEYPLSSMDKLDTYVDKIMEDYPKSDFSKQIQNTNKTDWSMESYNIGKDFAYSVLENTTPGDNYMTKGKDLVNKQLAIAGYRLSSRINYMMTCQKINCLLEEE